MIVSVKLSGEKKTINRRNISPCFKTFSNELIKRDLVFQEKGIWPSVQILDSCGNHISEFYLTIRPNSGIDFEQFESNRIIQDIDSNFVFIGSGTIMDHGQFPNIYKEILFVIKFDQKMNILWSRIWDYSNNGVSGLNIIVTSESSYLVSARNFRNIILLNIDKNGNFIWSKEISSSSNISNLIETINNDYLICTSNSQVIKLDHKGLVRWSRQYDLYDSEGAVKILEFNQNYYLLKSSYSNPLSQSYSKFFDYHRDMMIVKIDSSGNSNISHRDLNVQSTSVIRDTLNYQFTKKDTFYGQISDTVLFVEKSVRGIFKDSTDCIGVETENVEKSNGLIKLYPNPFNGTFYVEINEIYKPPFLLELYNSSGVLVQKIDAFDNHKIQIDLNERIIGFLTIKLTSKNFIKTQKIVCF